MEQLELENALLMAKASLQTGRRLGLAPLAVAVLDVRGVIKTLLAEEGTSLLRNEIAIAKAMSALNMGFGGRALLARAQQNPGFFASLDGVSGGKMVPVPGSVLIRTAEGELLGAVGISGDTAENDEKCAVAGIEAAGWLPETGGTK